MTDSLQSDSTLHFVGVGGIGMSGLAQMCRSLGCRVSGSDRALNKPENQRIFDALRKQGILLYPQDGSGVTEGKPDFLVYSTAIEEDNPDFKAGKNVARLHRSAALEQAMNLTRQEMIAVTGSCGKTTVTSWLAETLYHAGCDPSFLAGGLVNSFRRHNLAGNYYHGHGSHFVFEADESDKSLLAYHPEYALVLNIGTDHYSKDELIRVFRQFVGQVKTGLVIERDVADMLGADCMKHLKVVTFSARADGDADWSFRNYHRNGAKFQVDFSNVGRLELPLPGEHNAANMTAILAAFAMLGLSVDTAAVTIGQFKGVWRRFDLAGRIPSGAAVYDDYAHNVEKIVSCLKAGRQVASGKVVAVFQPHGFGPFKFMREELGRALKEVLRPEDLFLLLPVYYAGGTSAFAPTAEEVAAGYRQDGLTQCCYCADRKTAAEMIRARAGENDVVLIMGARDNSLSDWAAEVVGAGSV